MESAPLLNAAARLVFRLRRHGHITDALAVLHWLRVPQRVEYKVAVMAYPDQLIRVADLPGRVVVIICAHPNHTGCRFPHIV